MRNHITRKGDCVLSIAKKSGMTGEKLWDHPENKKLKTLRNNPSVLNPGDIVLVPDKEIKEVPGDTEKQHKFKLKIEQGKFRFRFIQNDQLSPAQQDYKLNIDGQWFSGCVNAGGWIECNIRPDSKNGKILFKWRQDREIELKFGHLNPVSEIEGVQQRLANLGFYNTKITAENDHYTMISLIAFQKYMGHDPDGKLKPELLNTLTKVHGS